MGIWNELDEPLDLGEDTCPDPNMPPLNSYVRLNGDVRIYYDSECKGPYELVPDGSYGRVVYHPHEDPEAIGVCWFVRRPGRDDGYTVLTSVEVNASEVERITDDEFDEWLRPTDDMTWWRVVALFLIIAVVAAMIVARIIMG